MLAFNVFGMQNTAEIILSYWSEKHVPANEAGK